MDPATGQALFNSVINTVLWAWSIGVYIGLFMRVFD
jgi:hypothetical protein